MFRYLLDHIAGRRKDMPRIKIFWFCMKSFPHRRIKCDTYVCIGIYFSYTIFIRCFYQTLRNTGSSVQYQWNVHFPSYLLKNILAQGGLSMKLVRAVGSAD